MLDYKLLEAFAAVVSEGGFEKAAKTLNLTQSAVSQRVKSLEEQLGGILLVRSTPPKPTEAGTELLKHHRLVKRLEQDLDMGLTPNHNEFTTLTVGLNADSLATWFLPAIQSFLISQRILLDLSVDDQEETHKLLKEGMVLGCISARPDPFQGCRAEYLGDMDYRLYGTPTFAKKWFPKGATLKAMAKAPLQIFNRRDTMHEVLFKKLWGKLPKGFTPSYIPSSERFADLIITGLVCGMLPEQQANDFVKKGILVDLLPGAVSVVRLYWHCWNLESWLLKEFSRALVLGAQPLLTLRPTP